MDWDKRTRNLAVPFQSHPFELEPHAAPGETDDQLQLLIDPTITADTTKTLSMSRPEKGDLVEMYLFMQMTAEAAASLEVKLGITSIASDHTPISGMTGYYTATAGNQLTIEANLFHRIPARGEANFVSDYFPLLVEFNSLPDPANGYSLDKFFCHGSAQMALT